MKVLLVKILDDYEKKTENMEIKKGKANNY